MRDAEHEAVPNLGPSASHIVQLHRQQQRNDHGLASSWPSGSLFSPN
ncbi:hypothetical protein M3J09_011608 [Ascochyta lentis]